MIEAKSREHPWAAAFLKAFAREDVAAVTVRGYRSDLGVFTAWYDGHAIEELTASDLAHFRQHLSRDRAMKPASVNRKLEALRRFCRWAHTTGKLPPQSLGYSRPMGAQEKTSSERDWIKRALRLRIPVLDHASIDTWDVAVYTACTFIEEVSPCA